MRVLAIVPGIYDTSPGQRYRIEQWEPLLRERGVEITYEPFECKELHAVVHQPGLLRRKAQLAVRSVIRRFEALKRVTDFDLVYIFREAALLGPPVFERMIHRSGVPVVFDFDDAIFVSYRSPSNGYLSYLKFANKTKTICRLSSHVMVGNPYLADYARQVNQNVTVIPTTIDTEKYPLLDAGKNAGTPVIGWTGSFSTAQHLDTLRHTLQKLAAIESFRLRVIGATDYSIEGVHVDTIRWTSEREVQDLEGIDIGIMPLPDDNWTQGKCGLKALQFMALGIPTVLSPIGVNKEIIQDNENGFQAANESEWIEKLTRLLRSKELRERLGRAGRKTVEERYSAQTQAPRVYEIFKSVLHETVPIASSVPSHSAGAQFHG